MYDSSIIGAALRTARKARGLSIAELAEQAEVSPRLISEVERGARPHVSLATMIRLLTLVGAELCVSLGAELDEEIARRERAEHRRRTWTGFKSTLSEHDDPPPPASRTARLEAVASASQLVYALQRAPLHVRVAERDPAVDRDT